MAYLHLTSLAELQLPKSDPIQLAPTPKNQALKEYPLLPCPAQSSLFSTRYYVPVCYQQNATAVPWPQSTRTFHVPTYPCPCHKALIATVPQEAHGKLQDVAYLQKQIGSA
jgi:hypothetical protein